MSDVAVLLLWILKVNFDPTLLLFGYPNWDLWLHAYACMCMRSSKKANSLDATRGEVWMTDVPAVVCNAR